MIGLGVRRQPAVSADVLGLPGSPDIVGQLGVPGGLVVPAEHPGDPGHQAGAVREVGGGDITLVGGDERAEVGAGPAARFQPFAPVKAAVPQVLLVRCRAPGDAPTRSGCRWVAGDRLGAVQPGDHRGPQFLQDLGVAVGAVQLPRHDHDGVAPAGRAVEERDRTFPALPTGAGADVRDRAVRPLVGGDVAQPLGREPGDVVEERGGRDEHLPVGGPAGPLAVRAVGGDVADVVPQAPAPPPRAAG